MPTDRAAVSESRIAARIRPSRPLRSSGQPHRQAHARQLEPVERLVAVESEAEDVGLVTVRPADPLAKMLLVNTSE